MLLLRKKTTIIRVLWAFVICVLFCVPNDLKAQEGTKWNEQGHSERISMPGRTLDEPFSAPIILGDQNALSSVVGIKIGNVNKAIRLKNTTLNKVGEDLLLEGYLN